MTNGKLATGSKLYHTIIPQISGRLSFRLSVCLSVSRFARNPFARFASNSANVLLRIRRCAALFELVRMWSNYKIKRLRVVFAMPSPPPMLLSAIPPTVAHSIALLAGDTGRSYTTDFLRNGEQSADNRRTILTLPSVLSAVCIAQN